MELDHIALLEAARMRSLAGEYRISLELVEQVLMDLPCDVEALRLKGNTIELSILGHTKPTSMDTRCAEILAARRCYEKILEKNPRDYLALKDLADHAQNFGSKLDALKQYEILIEILKNAVDNGEDVEDQLSDALQDYVELGQAGDDS